MIVTTLTAGVDIDDRFDLATCDECTTVRISWNDMWSGRHFGRESDSGNDLMESLDFVVDDEKSPSARVCAEGATRCSGLRGLFSYMSE